MLPPPDQPQGSSSIRTDPAAIALIDEYRRRFSSGPVGVWVDCYDEFMGTGFRSFSGKKSEITFGADGTGRSLDEEETIVFEWRAVGDRVIEVRCVERIPAPQGWSDEEFTEDREWRRLEYDFLVLKEVDAPSIFEVGNENARQIAAGSIDAFSGLDFLTCLSRFGAVHRLRGESKLISPAGSELGNQGLIWFQVDAENDPRNVPGRAAMLDWSPKAYKFTLGIGALALTAIVSELWRPVLPFWAIMTITMLPLALFLIADPSLLPATFVRISQVAASVWYLLVAIGLTIALARGGALPRGWPLFSVLTLVGAIPCGLVLYRAARGR